MCEKSFDEFFFEPGRKISSWLLFVFLVKCCEFLFGIPTPIHLPTLRNDLMNG